MTIADFVAELHKRSQELEALVRAHSSDIAREFVRAREWYDRHEIGRFIAEVEAKHGMTENDFMGMLAWSTGHLGHAKKRGRISAPTYQRVLVEFRDDFAPARALEGNYVGLMWIVNWTGLQEREVRKRRMTRDVFEWVKASRQDEELIVAVLSDDPKKSERAILEAERRVQDSLTKAVAHVLQREGGDKYLRVIVRNNRLQTGVKAEHANVRSLLWEWLPAYKAIDKSIDALDPVGFVFQRKERATVR
jgi:hypothetical protein